MLLFFQKQNYFVCAIIHSKRRYWDGRGSYATDFQTANYIYYHRHKYLHGYTYRIIVTSHPGGTSQSTSNTDGPASGTAGTHPHANGCAHHE